MNTQEWPLHDIIIRQVSRISTPWTRPLHTVISSYFLFTAYALAISAAYSSIEELRCEPRHKPGESVVEDGQWNSRIVDDLKKRLSDLGINPDQETIWAVRGRLRELDTKTAPPSGRAANWNRARVKDRIVPLYEAILLSSRIRHKASSHATKSITRTLTPIDLTNVQSLCRQLLMAKVGMWKTSEKDWPISAVEFRTRI